MQLQKPVVIIFINVHYSLTTIGTGNLNCNKWDTKLDQSDVSIEKSCIFDFITKYYLVTVFIFLER